MARDHREIFDFSRIDQTEIILCNDLPPVNDLTEDTTIAMKKGNGKAYTVEDGDWHVQSNLSDFLATYLDTQTADE